MLKPIINDAEPMPTKGSFRESKYQWLEEIEVGQSFEAAQERGRRNDPARPYGWKHCGNSLDIHRSQTEHPEKLASHC